VEKSYLYVIAASPIGPVKLGISGDPERRLRQLQTGHAQRLHLHHMEPVAATQARLYEGLLHRAFNHHRLHGEWFNMATDDAVAYIKFILIEHEESDLIP
jgi:hypothetical protein